GIAVDVQRWTESWRFTLSLKDRERSAGSWPVGQDDRLEVAEVQKPALARLHDEGRGHVDQDPGPTSCNATIAMQRRHTPARIAALIVRYAAARTAGERSGNLVAVSVGKAYVRAMEVTFTKVDNKRYTVAIMREHGPALLPRSGPGYDDLMPHDLAHYVVEEYFEIELGVWGQLAAGGCGILTPAPQDNTLKYKRRGQRIGQIGRDDMARSEQLVVVIVAAWERSIDRVKHQTRAYPIDIDAETLQGAVGRIDDVARRWQRLQHGA